MPETKKRGNGRQNGEDADRGVWGTASKFKPRYRAILAGNEPHPTEAGMFGTPPVCLGRVLRPLFVPPAVY
ncbi:hypothetical protein GWI33_005087 [Rhynchophorus ferrugineus]|uniref:Uncharacterized protein n=1 Tax=Rhynchophorus ferrugineus TaxID=354439 RepID=A0A834II39_RHYFE|nr:hypothetical protein GWI33_005087 [Rhynchophorus ferrugineus]